MLHSETIGKGENTIIFVHGNSQSLHTWDAVISQQVLSDYTTIALDLPGHGLSFRSTDPENDYTAKGLAKHVNDFLQQYADRKYILVGASLGTAVISELNPFPAACKGALLSGAMMSTQGITVKDMIQPGVSVAANFKADPTDEEIDYLISLFIYKPTPELKEHYKAVFRQTDPNLRAYLGQSLSVPPVMDKIANVVSAGIPIAIVYGTEEKIVQSDYLDRTTLRKWKDQIFKIKDAGHCVELDQPAAFANLLAEFAKDCFTV